VEISKFRRKGQIPRLSSKLRNPQKTVGHDDEKRRAAGLSLQQQETRDQRQKKNPVGRLCLPLLPAM